MSEHDDTDLTDKELNFKALRDEKKALEAQLAELQPLKVAQTVRAAGFDPDTPAGRALSRLADANSDVDAVWNLATELGFTTDDDTSPTPPATLSQNERAAQEFAQRQNALSSVVTSDTPPTFDNQVDELNKLISIAKASGNNLEVRRLNSQLIDMNNRLLAQQMAVKARG